MSEKMTVCDVKTREAVIAGGGRSGASRPGRCELDAFHPFARIASCLRSAFRFENGEEHRADRRGFARPPRPESCRTCQGELQWTRRS
jgi:hypothetical protein